MACLEWSGCSNVRMHRRSTVLRKGGGAKGGNCPIIPGRAVVVSPLPLLVLPRMDVHVHSRGVIANCSGTMGKGRGCWYVTNYQASLDIAL